MPDGLRVGVLSPFVGGDYYGAVIAGVNAAAVADGARVTAFQTLDPGAQGADYCPVPRYPHDVSWQHLDVVVVLPHAVQAAGVRRLQRSGRPVVLVAHDLAGVGAPIVRPDNRCGVRQAVEHLVGHGHRRIAFAGRLAVADVRERYEGYCEGLRARGLEPDPELLLLAPDNHESGGRAVAALLADRRERGGEPLTAVVLGTDRNALGLIDHLRAAGHRLPDDLAVVGFDNIIDGWYARPALSSVHQPLDRLGALAYQEALRLVSGEPGAGRAVAVPTSFVGRASCGCPGSALRITGSQARGQFADNTFLQQALNTQYELGIELLRTHDRDLRAMAWLGRTPARAGVLGLWPQDGPDAPTGGGTDPAIEVVGSYHADGRAGPAAGRTVPVSAFPPPALFEVPDGAAGEIVFVVPVRSASRDWGLLAAVGRIQDSTPPGREMMNHSGSLLAVALDHDVVLRSLHEQQEQLRRAALYDPLTGLPNRTLFLDRLAQTLQRAARRPERHFALLFLDLDGFKTINDAHGHAAGDAVLTEVAARLERTLRGSDTAARLGGDEFVVLLDALGHPDEAAGAVERVRIEVCQPVTWGDDMVTVGVSIGVAHSADGPAECDDLIRRADAAMYRAKAASRAARPVPLRARG